jgi:hypothetical protein
MTGYDDGDNDLQHAGFEVLTSVIINRCMFWDVTLSERELKFRKMYCLHLQGQRASQVRNHHSYSMIDLLPDPEDEGMYFLKNVY